MISRGELELKYLDACSIQKAILHKQYGQLHVLQKNMFAYGEWLKFLLAYSFSVLHHLARPMNLSMDNGFVFRVESSYDYDPVGSLIIIPGGGGGCSICGTITL